MENYTYHEGAVHNDNRRQFFFEGVTPDVILALAGIEKPDSEPATSFVPVKVVETTSTPRKRKKTKKGNVPVSASYMTFKLGRLNESRLIAFHDYLIQHSIIGNQLADFLPLFAGECNDCQVTWTDDASRPTLVELFRTMEKHRLIIVPDGFTLIGILKAHFLDMEGKPLTGLDKGNEMHPQYQSIIDDCMRLLEGELLNTVSDVQESRYSRFDTKGMHVRSRTTNSEDMVDLIEQGKI